MPRAVRMFAQRSLNPHYFANPPAFTYLLHFLFAIAYGGGAGVVHATSRTHPADVYTLARVAAAVLGDGRAVAAVRWPARACSAAAVGLLAAAIEAVAFLPVFYAHLALNDAPTLAPLTLSLLGTAGVLRKGRARDYLLAGVGLGLACATKYTAGIVLVPLSPRPRARALRGRAGAPASARSAGSRSRRRGGAWRVPDRESLLGARLPRLPRRTRAPVDARRPKPRASWARPARAASSTTCGRSPGGSAGCRRWRRSAARSLVWRSRGRGSAGCSCPAPLLFLRVHGPAGPLLRALAAADLPDPVPARRVLRAPARRRDRRRGRDCGTAASARCARAAVIALCCAAALLRPGPRVQRPLGPRARARRHAQPDARSGWSRTSRRGAPIVVEPVAPDDWARELEQAHGRAHGAGTSTPRWSRGSTPAARSTRHTHVVGIEDYERTLRPALIGYYERTATAG